MAQQANAYETYDVGSAGGNREDLLDKIFNIDPKDCPFTRMIGKSKASSTKHDWLEDTLRAADEDNAKEEGHTFEYDDLTPPIRPNNYTQIMSDNVRVTGTQDAVNKAGRSSELGYQVQKARDELKRDREAILLKNQAAVQGTANGATLRRMAGLSAFLATNASRGAGGANGGYATAPHTPLAATDGTQRAFTKGLLDDTLQLCHEAGANISVLMVNPFNKRQFSSFMSDANVAQQRTQVSSGQAEIVAAADTYHSDWGPVNVVPNRNMGSSGRSAFLLDPSYISIASLRPMQVVRPGVTGDSKDWQILCEETLRVDTEKSQGIIADLTTA